MPGVQAVWGVDLGMGELLKHAFLLAGMKVRFHLNAFCFLPPLSIL
jgi:hypothetical protein